MSMDDHYCEQPPREAGITAPESPVASDMPKKGKPDADEQFRRGVAYEQGNPGVAPSNHEAAKCYRIAAEQGHSQAQWRLGRMYEYGLGVDLSYPDARKWYKESAEQGNPEGAREFAIFSEFFPGEPTSLYPYPPDYFSEDQARIDMPDIGLTARMTCISTPFQLAGVLGCLPFYFRCREGWGLYVSYNPHQLAHWNMSRDEGYCIDGEGGFHGTRSAVALIREHLPRIDAELARLGLSRGSHPTGWQPLPLTGNPAGA